MSRVESVTVHPLLVPQPRPVANALGPLSGAGVVVVELRDTDGVVGQGWSHVIGGGPGAVAAFVREDLAPLVQGSDPDAVRATWQRMYRHTVSRGRKGVALYALSAVDLALWDLRCRAAGLPLGRALGTVRSAVPVYGDGCWVDFTTAELAEAAEDYRERGFWGVKVKVGPDLATAEQRVATVRETLGPAGRVMVDANQCLDLGSATRLARRLEDYDVTWLEEPLPADTPRDLAALRARTGVPLAAGENEYTRYGFRELLELGAVDVLQPDVHRAGGVTEFLRVAALAEAWNLPVAPHTSWEVHSQLLACVETGLAVEHWTWFPEDFFDERPDIVDGTALLSERPGLGSHVAGDALRRYTVPEGVR